MHVLHVYSGNLFGGIERMLISIAALGGTECPHSFALCFEGRLSQALRQVGAATEILPSVRIARPLSVLRARRALTRHLKARAFDAVICHSIWSYCIFAPAIIAAKRCPILFLHDAPEPRSFLYRWAWLRRPKLCIANSAYIAGLVAGMRPPVPVEVVHPLVPEPALPNRDEVRRLRERLGAGEQQVVILQASRLDEWKGHRNLLKALSQLIALPGWVCWVAGAPQRPAEVEYHRELLGLVEAYGLTARVHFIGHRDDMATVLSACDIYCQPNETPEPFGMVFVEALFAGKPVVGSKSGGTLDIVTPECGILCATNDGSLSVALKRLVVDPGVRAELSGNAPKRAQHLCGAVGFSVRLQQVLETSAGST